MSGRNRYYGNNNRKNNGNNSRGNESSIPPNLHNIGIQDLLGGKHLEYVAAALLLTGKLQVDSVELFRGAPVINVNLVGKYTTKNNNKPNPLSDFLDQNGDMTIDDIVDAFKNKLDKG